MSMAALLAGKSRAWEVNFRASDLSDGLVFQHMCNRH